MEDHDPLGVGAGGLGGRERARRRGVAVDLAVALVGEDAEVVALGEREEAAPVGRVGDRALRVRRRADVGERDPVEERRRQRGVVGQEAGLGGRRHRHRLGAGGERRGAVGLVERVRHQHRRPRARLGLGREREGGVEQALAGAVQRDHLGVGVDRDAVAAGEPGGDGGAELGGALVRRVEARTRGRARRRSRRRSPAAGASARRSSWRARGRPGARPRAAAAAAGTRIPAGLRTAWGTASSRLVAGVSRRPVRRRM